MSSVPHEPPHPPQHTASHGTPTPDRMVAPPPGPFVNNAVPRTVSITNNGGFLCTFAVRWNGGESPQTSRASLTQTKVIDMTQVDVPIGTSCWIVARIDQGKDHESSRNFTVGDGANVGANVSYTITGTTLNAHFD